MGYFDLNIPYPEPSGAKKKSTIDSNRTRLAVKAMELGYSGIAYNRTITGVMSDQHRCSISPLAISSLLNILPSLSLSAKLHRHLLRIPISTPFRQYTRLTVCVDNGLQCQALNSGNPILKTYDLVAVKPLNQCSFDLACERMEVDIISIDFSTKLPFRLKQQLIKAAAKRGVHFEVTYACLIPDSRSRRQLISNAKLLIDWTRGRNIVFSSAAPSVNEFRGPLDVANLLSLLGLSKDRAKEAISRNCRILLAKSLKKKRFYKEAIRVEVLSSDVASHSKEGWYQELLKWDPISSGEGDILLDDLTKSLSTSCEPPKTVKAINFDSIPSQGFQVKDFLPASNVFDNSTELPNRLNVCPERGESSLSDAIATHQVVSHEAFNLKEDMYTPTNATKLESRTFIDSDVNCTPFATKAHVSESNLCTSSNALDTVTPYENKKLSISSADVKLDDAHNIDHKVEIFTPDPYLNAQMARMRETFPKHGVLEISTSITEKLMDGEQYNKCKTDAVELDEIKQQTPDEQVASVTSRSAKKRAKPKKSHLARMHETFPKEDLKIAEHGVSEINTSISENLMDGGQFTKCKTDAVVLNEIPQQKPDEKKMEDDSALLLQDGMLEDIKLGKVSTGYEQVASVTSLSDKKRAKPKKSHLARMHETFPKEDLKIAEHGVSEINTSISENLMDGGQFTKCKTDAVVLNEIPQQKPDEKKMEDDSALLLQDGMLEDIKLGKVSTGYEQVASVTSLSDKKRAKPKKSHLARMHETFPKEDLKIAEHGVSEINTSISENLMDGGQFTKCKTDAVVLNEIPQQKPDEKKMEDDSVLLLPDGMLEDIKLGKVSTGYVQVASVTSRSDKKRAKPKKSHLARMHETFPKEDLKIAEHGVSEINTSISENLMDGGQFTKCKTDAVVLNEIPQQKPDEKKMEDDSALLLPDGMLEDIKLGKVSTGYEQVASVKSRSDKKRAKPKKSHLARMHETFPKEDLKIAEHGVSEINTSISENLMDGGQFTKCKTDAVVLNEIPQQKPDEKKMEDDSALLLPDGMLEDIKLGKVSTGYEQVASVKSRSGRRGAKRKKPDGVSDSPSHFDMQLLNPVLVPFKKNSRKKKSKTKIT